MPTEVLKICTLFHQPLFLPAEISKRITTLSIQSHFVILPQLWQFSPEQSQAFGEKFFIQGINTVSLLNLNFSS